jgi:ribosomal protein S18 acetylase RimI-like enzyme
MVLVRDARFGGAMTGEEGRACVSCGGKNLDAHQIVDMLRMVERALPDYPFDQFKNYPSKDAKAWEHYFMFRLSEALKDKEWMFFFGKSTNRPNLIGCRIPKWDEDHFGIRMASIQVFIGQDGSELRKLLEECLKYLREKRVVFVSARINGDNMDAIHEFQAYGFRYYENIIWPVQKCNDISRSENVRLMAASDLDRVVQIAQTSSFQRSHFHCDDRFPKEKVDSMPAKWIKTSWEKKDPVAVIKSDGKVVGYFAFAIDKSLSEVMGYRYARMRHLALGPEFRGQGLGKALFGGTIALMKDMGADYVDSGYASKNHMSARLHVQHAFESVYEEVTLHLWLEDAR